MADPDHIAVARVRYRDLFADACRTVPVAQAFDDYMQDILRREAHGNSFRRVAVVGRLD